MTRPRKHFLQRMGGAFLATVLIAPAIGALFPSLEFHRVLSRVFVGSLLVAFLVRQAPPREWPERVRAMGLRGPGRLRRFAAGAAISTAALALALLVSWLLGGRAGPGVAGRPPLPLDLLRAATAALLVSLFEETFFRGYVKDVWGGTLSAAFYSFVHFLRPVAGSAPVEGYDPLLALKRLPSLFGYFVDPRTLLFGVPALFVLGVALNRMRERTGTLYLGAGIHAGLVFLLALYPRWLSPDATGSLWVFGGPRLYDGAIGLAALLLLAAGARRL